MGAPIDLASARATFEASTDFTVGLEEEFALLDPATLDMVPRFEELRDAAAQEDPTLAAQITGELIASEIEIRLRPRRGPADAIARQRDLRRRLFALAALARHRARRHRRRIPGPTTASSASSTPSTTAASRRASATSARRNNTFSLHVHVGVQGADRAVRRLRPPAPGPAGAARVVGELAVRRRPRRRPALGAHA